MQKRKNFAVASGTVVFCLSLGIKDNDAQMNNRYGSVTRFRFVKRGARFRFKNCAYPAIRIRRKEDIVSSNGCVVSYRT